ncbi:hypothetical protein ACJJTC_014402, partial [Scirpophaga incertulas]
VSSQKNILPFDIKRKISEKRRLRRVWQQSHCPSDKTGLNRAIKELRSLLQCFSNAVLQRKLEEMSPNGRGERNLWRITKENIQPQQFSHPIRNGRSWARTNDEKAETFAKHLSLVFRPNDPVGVEDSEIEAILNQDFQMSLPITPTSPRE